MVKAALKRKPKAEEPSTSGSGEEAKVVYIGHLPHGFYEHQLRGFFSQFGEVTKVRVSRNKKTAAAKHYAFLEFKYPSVAKIAAETMDGYLMFAQKLQCRLMRPDEVHPALFKGANRVFDKKPVQKIERERHNRVRTPEEQRARVMKAVARDRRRAAKIKASGIDYEYSGLSATKKAVKISFD